MNIIIEHILKRVEQVDGKGLYIKVLRYIRIFSSLMILLLKLCQYININCSIIPGELWDINARNFIYINSDWFLDSVRNLTKVFMDI